MLYGPRYQNWERALAKTTSLHDKATLQIRVDAFDVFSHPTFANPAAAISNPAAVGTISAINGANRTLQ